MEYAVDVLQL